MIPCRCCSIPDVCRDDGECAYDYSLAFQEEVEATHVQEAGHMTKRASIVEYSRAAERRVAALLGGRRLPSTGAARQPDVMVGQLLAVEVKQGRLPKKWHDALTQARIAAEEVQADFAAACFVEKPGQGRRDGEVFLLLDARDWAALVDGLRSS